MEKVVINDSSLKESEIDKKITKARALLVLKNKILVSNYGGVILLPGGKLDAGETNKEALIRELKEETGIIYDSSELNELFLLEYYQVNYPTRENTIINRLMQTYFYYGNFKGIDEGNRKITEKEKNGNFSLKLIEIEELLNNLSNPIGNPRSDFFNKELTEAIKVYRRIKQR